MQLLHLLVMVWLLLDSVVEANGPFIRRLSNGAEIAFLSNNRTTNTNGVATLSLAFMVGTAFSPTEISQLGRFSSHLLITCPYHGSTFTEFVEKVNGKVKLTTTLEETRINIKVHTTNLRAVLTRLIATIYPNYYDITPECIDRGLDDMHREHQAQSKLEEHIIDRMLQLSSHPRHPHSRYPGTYDGLFLSMGVHGEKIEKEIYDFRIKYYTPDRLKIVVHGSDSDHDVTLQSFVWITEGVSDKIKYDQFTPVTYPLTNNLPLRVIVKTIRSSKAHHPKLVIQYQVPNRYRAANAHHTSLQFIMYLMKEHGGLDTSTSLKVIKYQLLSILQVSVKLDPSSTGGEYMKQVDGILTNLDNMFKLVIGRATPSKFLKFDRQMTIASYKTTDQVLDLLMDTSFCRSQILDSSLVDTRRFDSKVVRRIIRQYLDSRRAVVVVAGKHFDDAGSIVQLDSELEVRYQMVQDTRVGLPKFDQQKDVDRHGLDIEDDQIVQGEPFLVPRKIIFKGKQEAAYYLNYQPAYIGNRMSMILTARSPLLAKFLGAALENFNEMLTDTHWEKSLAVINNHVVMDISCSYKYSGNDLIEVAIDHLNLGLDYLKEKAESLIFKMNKTLHESKESVDSSQLVLENLWELMYPKAHMSPYSLIEDLLEMSSSQVKSINIGLGVDILITSEDYKWVKGMDLAMINKPRSPRNSHKFNNLLETSSGHTKFVSTKCPTNSPENRNNSSSLALYVQVMRNTEDYRNELLAKLWLELIKDDRSVAELGDTIGLWQVNLVHLGIEIVFEPNENILLNDLVKTIDRFVYESKKSAENILPADLNEMLNKIVEDQLSKYQSTNVRHNRFLETIMSASDPESLWDDGNGLFRAIDELTEPETNSGHHPTGALHGLMLDFISEKLLSHGFENRHIISYCSPGAN